MGSGHKNGRSTAAQNKAFRSEQRPDYLLGGNLQTPVNRRVQYCFIMRDIGNENSGRQNEGTYAELLQGPQALSTLGKHWDDLFQRSVDAPPYLSRAWISTFITEGRLRGTPLFIVVWTSGKLVALLAIAVRCFMGVKIAEPIGTGEPSYLGVLSDPDHQSAIQCMADFIARESSIRALCFQDLSSKDRATNKLIDELHQRRFLYRRATRNPCPFIQLACSYEEYLKTTKSSKHRKKLRYAERKLSNVSDVVVHHYGGQEITPEVIRRIAKIQVESWMKRRGVAVLGQPFYQRLLFEMAKAGFGRVWVMTVDGHDAAFRYALLAHRRLYSKWTAFDRTYESLRSVGKVLTIASIRRACEEGLLSFDFGHGDSEWKRSWATDFYEVYRAVAGRGFAGRLVVLWFAFIWWLAKHQWLRAQYRGVRRRLLMARARLSSKRQAAFRLVIGLRQR